MGNYIIMDWDSTLRPWGTISCKQGAYTVVKDMTRPLRCFIKSHGNDGSDVLSNCAMPYYQAIHVYIHL